VTPALKRSRRLGQGLLSQSMLLRATSTNSEEDLQVQQGGAHVRVDLRAQIFQALAALRGLASACQISRERSALKRSGMFSVRERQRLVSKWRGATPLCRSPRLKASDGK